MSFGLIAIRGEDLWVKEPRAWGSPQVTCRVTCGLCRRRRRVPPSSQFGGVHRTVRVHLGQVLCGRVRRAAPVGGGAGGPGTGDRARAAPEPSPAAPSYKLYCDALTTTDGPCQTFPRLAALSTFGRTMGPEQRARPAACSRCARARSWAPASGRLPGSQRPLGVSDLLRSASSKEHLRIDSRQVASLKTCASAAIPQVIDVVFCILLVAGSLGPSPQGNDTFVILGVFCSDLEDCQTREYLV